MNADLQSRLEKILSEPVKLSTTVSGGCIADSQKLEMNSAYNNPIQGKFYGYNYAFITAQLYL